MIGLMAMLAAAATVPTPLAPSGKWVVDYQKDMCLVSRSFGPASANTLFALKPPVSMGENGQTLFVLSPNAGSTGLRRGQAVITLQPSGEQRKIRYVSWVPKGGKFRGYELHANADVVTLLGSSTGIGFIAGKDSFSFATGKMQAVLTALTTCNENLLKTWGVDPAARAMTPKGIDPGDWFPPESYPSDAKRRGVSGRSVIVLTVSPEGKPTSCRVVVSSYPSLDITTCNLAMRNGRFENVALKMDRYAVLAVVWLLFDS